METKNIAAIETHICYICGKKYETNSLLIDRNLDRGFKERDVTTGYSPCPECQKLIDDNYIACVECDPDKSKINGETANYADVYRTGKIIWLKKHIAKEIFKMDTIEEIAFITPDLSTMLEDIKKQKIKDGK